MLKLPEDEFVTIELVHDPSHGQVTPSGLSHVVVQVDDLRGLVQTLALAGVAVEGPSSPDESDDFLRSRLPRVADPL